VVGDPDRFTLDETVRLLHAPAEGITLRVRPIAGERLHGQKRRARLR
jgi:hypothetical protein